MITHSKIIDRIKKIINDNNLTSSSFADKIGVPRSSISHILSGRNNPSLDIILKILNNFDDINADILLKGKAADPTSTKKNDNLSNKTMTLFPEFDLKETAKEEIKNDKESIKSIILVYQNNKFEILKNK